MTNMATTKCLYPFKIAILRRYSQRFQALDHRLAEAFAERPGGFGGKARRFLQIHSVADLTMERSSIVDAR